MERKTGMNLLRDVAAALLFIGLMLAPIALMVVLGP